MTSLLLHPSALEQQIPDLLRGHAVVALVPATDLREWSAQMAWRIARAAAADGRRTALVDCCVDSPVLHAVTGASNDEGIVDAFEYGASLSRIVQEQPQANLFFIASGTFSPDPAPLLTHPRWRRLSAGFRHEEALLLLFVPAEHVDDVAAEPDGLIVLAPQGRDLAIAEAPGVAQAMGRGLPLIAVVGEEPAPELAASAATPAAQPEATEAEPAGAPPRRSSQITATLVLEQRRRPRWAVYAALFLAALAIGGYLYRAELAALAGLGPEPPTLPPRHVPHHPPPRTLDSLPYAIQVSAWPSLAEAAARADTLEARGFRAMVTPVRIGAVAWYRVQAGPMASTGAADSTLLALRAARLLAANKGSVASVPLSVALQGGLSLDSARALRAVLRRAGVSAFVLGQADRKFRIFVGAFDAAPQAALIQSLLTPTGSAGDIVPRVGFLP